MKLSLIAAVSENGVIGKDGGLPWRISEDLKRFKALTTGHPVLMGRKTYESILAALGRPLPKRTSLVLTRATDFSAPEGVEVYHDPQSALSAHEDEHIFCIGGGQIYAATFGLADRLIITHVRRSVEGDTYFPAIDPGLWDVESEERHDDFDFVNYVRKGVEI